MLVFVPSPWKVLNGYGVVGMSPKTHETSWHLAAFLFFFFSSDIYKVNSFF